MGFCFSIIRRYRKYGLHCDALPQYKHVSMHTHIVTLQEAIDKAFVAIDLDISRLAVLDHPDWGQTVIDTDPQYGPNNDEDETNL